MSYAYDAILHWRNVGGAEVAVYVNTDGYQPVASAGQYRRVLRQPGSIARHLWGAARTRGPRTVEYGTLVCNNAGRVLDDWVTLSWDDCAVVVYRSPTGNREAREVVFAGRLGRPTFSGGAVSFPLRDQLHRLDRPLLTERYAGTNVLPDGLEGTDDIQGQIKPWFVGKIFHAEPPLVNVTRRVYQASVYQLQSGWDVGVYVDRASVTKGLARTIGEMLAGVTYSGTVSSINTGTDVITFTGAHGIATATAVNARVTGGSLPAPLASTTQYYYRAVSGTTGTLHPTASDATGNTNIVNITTAGSGTITISENQTAEGCWDYCNDAGDGFYFRLGTEPDGIVTIIGENPAPSASNAYVTPSPSNGLVINAAMRYLLATSGYVPDAGGDVTLTGTAATLGNTAGCGVWIDDDRSVLACLNDLASAGGLGWYFASDSSVVLAELLDPAAQTATVTISNAQVIDAQYVRSSDDDEGVPAWRVVVNHMKNYTVQRRSEIPTAVAISGVQFAGKEWRQAADAGVTVLDQWPRSPEIIVYAWLIALSPALSLAARLQALYGVLRFMVQVTVSVNDADGLSPGVIAQVTYDSLLLDGGVKMFVLGVMPDYEAGAVSFIGWY